MFTVAQFFENQQLCVLAVPASWVRNGYLMWPKLSSNEKLDKMRKDGMDFHGATKKIPVITSRKYKSLKAAEAAAEELLKHDVSDIEAKRKLLKSIKTKSGAPQKPRDYNKIIETIASSNAVGQFTTNSLPHQEHILEVPGVAPSPLLTSSQKYASGIGSSQPQDRSHERRPPGTQENVPGPSVLPVQKKTSVVLQMPSHSSDYATSYLAKTTSEKENNSIPEDGDMIPADLLELTQNQEPHRSIFVGDDGIVYVNSSTNDCGAINAPGNLGCDPRDEFKVEMEWLKSEMANLKTEMQQMKLDIIDSVKTGVRQAVEDCFEKNLPRFATMLNMTNRVEEPSSQVQEGKSVEDHKLINDEEDVTNFNKLLANADVFNDYIKYFSKIIAPATYSERGDSACYLIVDCLFTRAFWNTFTWTGINRGSKSKRGFREFANVLQLLLAIVRTGDPTYTIKKLESFCKDKLFRYSKARSTSKQLRKPACRQKRVKKASDAEDDVTHDNGKDDDEQGSYSGQTDNATSDFNEDRSDDDVEDESPSQDFAGFSDV